MDPITTEVEEVMDWQITMELLMAAWGSKERQKGVVEA